MTTIDTTSTATEWQAVSVRRQLGDPYAPVPGEPTPAAGLVIVPDRQPDRAAYTGRWALVHTASGLALLIGRPLAYAREAAALLAQYGIDWTQAAEALRAPGNAARMAWEATAAGVDKAWDQGRPAWWGRTSWHEDGAGWWLRCAAPCCEASEDYERCWHDDAEDAAADARQGGWSAVDDDHWLCPDCAADHRLTD